jgi:hypothetical protein
MYLTIPLALARAKERCQRESERDDGLLTELLLLSAGSAEGVTHYRPFYAAARFIAQDPDIRDLARAEGEAEFTLAQPRIDDLMGFQFAYDSAYNLTVPRGMEADAFGVSPVKKNKNYIAGTSSITTTPVL